jgi:hypothetical protein
MRLCIAQSRAIRFGDQPANSAARFARIDGERDDLSGQVCRAFNHHCCGDAGADSLSLTSVASADGGSGGSGSVRIGFLVGDVNQNRIVSVADLGLVNAQLAQTVTAANYLKDVNASGTLTVADKGITNANLTRALPAP